MPRPAAPPSPGSASVAPAGPIRLQKILAAAGLGSRRQCEELILSGRVEVDRQVVNQLGAKADPAEQEVRVDGVSLPKTRLVYFMVNKPTGVLSTNNDPSGRPRVIDLVPYTGRLFTVGRLDMSSEGLILVTNDGELADRLTHPRYGVEKTYQVEVAGSLDRKELDQLRKGVHLAEGFARVVSARVVRQYKHSTQLEIVLAEGRNREIRRILARVGHKVERLRRVAIGPLRLAELPLGQTRPLERDEVRQLKRAARGERAERKSPKAQKPRKPAAATKAGPPARTVIGGDQRKAAAVGKPRGKSVGGRPAGKTFAGKPSTGKSFGTAAVGRPRGKATGGKPRGTVIGGKRPGKPGRSKRGS